jgi:hypothetical protein
MNVEISDYILRLILSTRHLVKSMFTDRDYNYATFIFMKFKFYKSMLKKSLQERAEYFFTTFLVSTFNSNKAERSNMTDR